MILKKPQPWKNHFLHAVLCSLIWFFGCEEKNPPLFKLISPQASGLQFSNVLQEDTSLSVLNFPYIYNGAGVALGDINNDGLVDICFSANQVSGKIYLNKGNMQFEDISEKADFSTNRWSNGVSMVDINADGKLDIYICAGDPGNGADGRNYLFINQGEKNGIPFFEEKAQAYGLDDPAFSTQAAFFDYDRDGDLDMYLLTNFPNDGPVKNLIHPKVSDGSARSNDRLYRNDFNDSLQHPVFTNVTLEAGITMEGYGLGVVISDINLDGWPDVYVSDDFRSNDLLYINQQDGTFKNEIAAYLKHQSFNGMGADVADYNNDGLVDIVVVDMLPEGNKRQKQMLGQINYDVLNMERRYNYQRQYVQNTLQLNNGKGTDDNMSFSEIGQIVGMYKTDWSWAPLLADFDLDGLKDLYITNGYRKDITDLDYINYNAGQLAFGTEEARKKRVLESINKLEEVKLSNYMYQNNGDLTFSDRTEQWGLQRPSFSNGLAYGDLDNDGDLDLVVNNIDDPAFLYENQSNNQNKGNFLKIKLEGKTPNTQALGARISLKHGEQVQYFELYPQRGFLSSIDPAIVAGLGTDSIADEIKVVWPDGKITHLENVKANQVLELSYEKDAQAEKPHEVHIADKKVFQEVSKTHGIDFQHQSYWFVDFKVQPLLHLDYSQKGPGIAVGDINGDDLEDFFVGSGSESSGQLFVQQSNGQFTSKPLGENELDVQPDDMGTLLFDADQDGDLDLYVVSGGSRYPDDHEFYQDRFYRNDGKGNFQLDQTTLPEMLTSGSCVVAADYDQDGDLDLFVGGRIAPRTFPMPVRSYILQNNNGKFTDVTEQIAPELVKPGLVTSALWTDFDNDGSLDLIVSGEWMPVSFYRNHQGKLTNITDDLKLDKYTGWWNSLVGADFDQDGDMDYVAGNLGLNNKFQPSEAYPVCVYAKDFDNNGQVDPVMCYYVQNENVPAHPRDVLISQIPAIKKRFNNYKDYAEAQLSDVFTSEELEDAYVVKAQYFQSVYIENKGNGQFEVRPLPFQAQFAPVFGLQTGDFNGDGFPDILMGGNQHGTDIQSASYDAGIGAYLKGDGKGNFTYVSNTESNFMVKGQVRAIAALTLKNQAPLYLVAQNGDALKVFQTQPDEQVATYSVEADDAYAVFTYSDQKQQKVELYYGSGYLSQSSRTLQIPKNVKKIEVVSFSGEKRQLEVPVGEITSIGH